MDDETTMTEARIRHAFYAAPRLVMAAIAAPSDKAEAEWDAAMDDLWTDDPGENAERMATLVHALADYAALLARKAYGSRRAARDEAFVQVWAMIPDEDTARALIARQLEAADELAARLEH